MKRSELFFTALLIPLDALLLLLAFVVAYYLRDNVTLLSAEFISGISDRIEYDPSQGIQPFTQYIRYIWYILPAMIAIFALSGLYSLKRSTTFLQRFWRIFLGVSVGLFFILLLFLFKRDFFLPRTAVLYSWLLGIIFVTFGRSLLEVIKGILYNSGISVVRVAVLGTTDYAQSIAAQLTRGWGAQYARVEAPEEEIEDTLRFISRDNIDELIVASDRFGVDDIARLRNKCLEEHVAFSFVPRAFSAMQGAAFDIRDQLAWPLIEVRPTPLDGWGRIAKRIFDIIVSFLLIVLFSPLYLVIGIIMLLTSGGAPLVFRHKRIGRGGKSIMVSKYRSMRPDWSDKGSKLSPKFEAYLAEHPEAQKEWSETMKLKDDPRISSVGKFLRATRLDELPQFFDVLRGDLSLVGPRPIVESELEKFGEKARILFHVRPGVTGPWQVEGGNNLPYDERVRLNAHYIEHWSLWMDVIILVRTAGLLLLGFISKLFGKGSESEGY